MGVVWVGGDVIMEDSRMDWYHFRQNNTGGSFDVDEKVTKSLYIQAETEDEAEKKAFSLGVYYNGVEDGLDCGCCGDRWYGCDKLDLPHYSGATTVEAVAQYDADTYGWCSPDARIFYADGSVKDAFSAKRK